MPIPKKKYIQLKAMYDFQRKISYNKEKLKKAIDIMFDHPEVMFEDLWSKMKEDEMVDVPSDWVPEDDKLKIEGEE